MSFLIQLATVAGSAVAIYLAVIVYVRISGLRSFSKMSAFDFAMTIAVGSAMASTAIMADVSVVHGAVAIGALFLGQAAVAVLRRRLGTFSDLVDNEPVLLMQGPELIEENLRRTRTTRQDVMAKLREANVASLDEVAMVVMETTGDITVLHRPQGRPSVGPELLDGIRDGERLGQGTVEVQDPDG